MYQVSYLLFKSFKKRWETGSAERNSKKIEVQFFVIFLKVYEKVNENYIWDTLLQKIPRLYDGKRMFYV